MQSWAQGPVSLRIQTCPPNLAWFCWSHHCRMIALQSTAWTIAVSIDDGLLCSVQLPPAALFPLQPLLHPSAHNMLGVGEAMWCHFYPNVKKFFLNSRNHEGFWDTYLKAKLVDSCSCMLSKLMALFYFAFYVLWMVEIFDTFFFLLVENWWYFICNQIKVNVACTAGKQVTLQEHGWAARLLTDVFVTIKHFFKGICSNT